jgi:hypothetical protein
MGFSFFFHFSNLELKVFVEDSLNFTDYCVSNSIRVWITVFRRRLRKTGAKFYLKKPNNKPDALILVKNIK